MQQDTSATHRPMEWWNCAASNVVGGGRRKRRWDGKRSSGVGLVRRRGGGGTQGGHVRDSALRYAPQTQQITADGRARPI